MLRWRLFGISVCIQPSFWIINALFAWYFSDPLARMYGVSLPIFILIWVLCTLASVMAHLNWVTPSWAASSGQPGNVTIAGLGGQAAGRLRQDLAVEAPPRHCRGARRGVSLCLFTGAG